MKCSIILFAAQLPFIAFAQVRTAEQIASENPRLILPAEQTATGPLFTGDQEVKGKNFKFGLSIGPSYALTKTYSYTLRAPDYALTRQQESRAAFVLSGVVAYNKTAYYRHTDENGDPMGQPYARPYPLSALLSLNLAEFTNTGAAFNRQVDGGIGLGYRASENFHLGLFLEASARRFLYEAYDQYLDKPLPSFVASQPLTVLAQDDATYFLSKPVFSLTFKLVYIFSDELPKAKTVVDVQTAASQK